ncbi:MAG: preprotein translocase subunit SecE [Lachnospiraceae bacterium]|nr:preprotein translocase subunit SecE [Lachnospiraceae bacterium]
MDDISKTAVGSKPASFWKGVKAEFSKIIWPTKETLTKQSIAVVTITVITAALIAVIDRGLQYGINFVIK